MNCITLFNPVIHLHAGYIRDTTPGYLEADPGSTGAGASRNQSTGHSTKRITEPKGNAMSTTRTATAPAPAHRKKPSGVRVPALLAAAVVALAPAVMAVPATATSSKAGGTTLKLALTGDIDSLNPFKAILSSSTGILALQYQSLVAYGPKNNEDIPSMADKWETSTDGKVWTFHLPKDRKWSDGQPITAKDGAWTFSAIQKNDQLKQANGSLLSSVAAVDAKDDETLVITLKAPQAPNPGTQLPIMPEHVWSKVENPATFTNDKDAVGSGPFTVASYDKAAGVTMKSNPYYWQGKAKIDGITYASVRASSALISSAVRFSPII